ncbi:DUF1499 domain-containing protein [Halobacillus litoralis]|uniref:DUF1499 domain-containing protein n=1 Tax=Halobacillus litoralis TaxID=45668 RepID=UPI001CD77BC7|nr:DUF1499 domain-containing protein [Halobacillus litoralis]MCA0969739.1 DUF1499 domain-containing protein [Halobacillus litoralis]
MSNTHIGVKDGRLAECPSSPNCVSTQAEDESKKMDPLVFSGDLTQSKKLVKEVLGEMERTSIEDDSQHYIHAIVKSKILRFKDDVEFYFDEQQKLIHYRSASRVGYSDMGVNRKRMEEFASAYKKKSQQGALT